MRHSGSLSFVKFRTIFIKIGRKVSKETWRMWKWNRKQVKSHWNSNVNLEKTSSPPEKCWVILYSERRKTHVIRYYSVFMVYIWIITYLLVISILASIHLCIHYVRLFLSNKKTYIAIHYRKNMKNILSLHVVEGC